MAIQHLGIGLLNLGRTRIDGVLVPAGSDELVELADGESCMMVVLSGRLLVSREDKTKPWRQIWGTPMHPVILATPGTYRVFANQHTCALRIERSAHHEHTKTADDRS